MNRASGWSISADVAEVGARTVATRRGMNRRLRQPLHLSGRSLFLLLWALLFMMGGLWAAAVPISAGLDEPAHVINAAADVRGQIFKHGAEILDGAVEAFPVRVPATYTDGFLAPCGSTFQNAAVLVPPPSSCFAPPSPSGRVVQGWTYVGQYQPFYYLIVGLPSLFTSDTYGIYVMRLVSAALGTLFLALAFLSCFYSRSRPLLLAGVALGASPMVLFMLGTVQPNGVEVAAAISLWASGLGLVRGTGKDPSARHRLWWIAGVSAVALSLIRPLSPLWTVLIVVVLALMGDRRTRSRIRREASFKWSVAGAGGSLLLSGVWLLTQHGLGGGFSVPSDWVPYGVAAVTTFGRVLETFPAQLVQAVGPLGWSGAQPTFVVVAIWSAGAAVMASAAWLSRRFDRVTVCWLLTFALTLLLPAVISTVGADTNHWAVWYGRYSMPFGVGLVMLGGARWGEPPPGSLRLGKGMLALTALGQVWAYLGEASSFAVGRQSIFAAFLRVPGMWRPPLPPQAGFILLVVAVGVLTAVLLELAGPGSTIGVGSLAGSDPAQPQ
jgi:hypothetical protein